jgi:hypothetical protein
MDTVTCFIIFGPLIVLAIGMAIGIGIMHYTENKNV